MFNEEDYTVASLAKLVGTELHTIDKYTESGKGTPANKLDPRSFILKKNELQANRRNANVVRHDGMNFHAGVDENLVQSMYPDPVPSIPAPAGIETVNRSITTPATTAVQYFSTEPQNLSSNSTELVKILQSIDKTLKSIDKTEKAITKILTHLTTNNSDKDTSK